MTAADGRVQKIPQYMSVLIAHTIGAVGAGAVVIRLPVAVEPGGDEVLILGFKTFQEQANMRRRAW